MKLSKLYMPTLREVSADVEVASHKLLLRGAFIRKSASGIYTYLPLGYKVVKKIEKIVREEMDRAGSQEILMSAIQPREIWDASGRWDRFGPEMFKLKDRNDREFCLGPTAEEYFTTLIKDEVKSYKQLPLNLYQIQTKYRDEKRPRFGINRAREFSMKDAYSFDTSPETMEISYMEMYRAYERIFNRLNLDYKVVEGDSGAMGGNKSHEFIALAETGEGEIAYSPSGKYAATSEKAKVTYKLPGEQELKELKEVATPDLKTIEDVTKFLGIEKNRSLKAIDLMVEGKPVIVFIPGDRELNMSKLEGYLGVPEHDIELMTEEDILSINSSAGYTGPIGLDKSVRLIFDNAVTKIQNLSIGANKEGYHIINANYGRDFSGEVCEDLLEVRKGDIIEETGEEYLFARGIEVGNIFQLGTKYSEALNATYLDVNGKEKLIWMGSYGVGVTRTVSAIVEQNYDEDGIIWPMSVAPYQAIITVVNNKDEEQMSLGEKMYEELINLGVEVLLDDRNERAGVKFKDRDLIGIPLRVTVGKKAGEEVIEYSNRKDKEKVEMTSEESIKKILEEIKRELSL
ncbi:proline--tRNA ligase [Anaerosphaera multitolerans]|uniref:Proline--tRNA ligase n=1 Tax=Anaerosphaera multitolerans TaxID=2487351 RepID=A0A437S4J2_9FIRM|nr:proline--tRNA ligase [Anaerosphaera multitolerans]RVU53876.1 proline--tRNA ligase [Anaerosphaera multitolerans]